MKEEQLKAEIEKVESQQKALENDWHAIRGAIAAYRQMLAAVQQSAQESAPIEPSDSK